ncbi:MAG: hypothetical protein U0K92_07465 [Treponema sp.]|nr:hypothetical protein [Treponema sp.]
MKIIGNIIYRDVPSEEDFLGYKTKMEFLGKNGSERDDKNLFTRLRE